MGGVALGCQRQYFGLKQCTGRPILPQVRCLLAHVASDTVAHGLLPCSINSLLQVRRAQKANVAPKGAVMPGVQTPQDMVKVFAETQKNMMELNR